ncbi:DUF6480 family protein [Rhodococcus sp. NPDC058521]|uniref:DUF6480 family protein n=1 Tax=Rhodococcus sp. NPDC058521 TaxID=3346536 RepID=UPI0036651E63
MTDANANPGPDPEETPNLEAGGGVRPGDTPPDAGQTSGHSAPEPRTSWSFPPTGVGAIIATVVLVLLFAAAAVWVVLDVL